MGDAVAFRVSLVCYLTFGIRGRHSNLNQLALQEREAGYLIFLSVKIQSHSS